jgi:predicted O-methyltransferase YrrM
LQTQETSPSAQTKQKARLVFNQWFLSDKSLRAPEWIESSNRAEFAPFIFWLIDLVRPKKILDIGTKDGHSFLLFCQALDQSAIDGKCVTLRHWLGSGLSDDRIVSVDGAQKAHLISRYRNYVEFLGCSIDSALDHNNDAVDVINIDALNFDSFNEDSIDRLFKTVSKRGVIIVQGINLGSKNGETRRFWSAISSCSTVTGLESFGVARRCTKR